MMLVLRLQHQLRTTGLENVLEEVKLQEPPAACWLHWEEPLAALGGASDLLLWEMASLMALFTCS